MIIKAAFCSLLFPACLIPAFGKIIRNGIYSPASGKGLQVDYPEVDYSGKLYRKVRSAGAMEYIEH